MTNREGTPIRYELMTHAPDASQKFYAKVMDWQFQKVLGAPGRGYRIFTDQNGEAVGGMMEAPEGAGFAPLWAIYFCVADVDAMTQRGISLGGSIHMEPQDIPGVGRFSFVADPQGALFYLMRGDSATDSTAFAPTQAGHCSWNELITGDQNAAQEFYGELFGWKKTGAMPMGERGDYTFFGKGDVEMFGAMMNANASDTHPFWHIASNVQDIDAVEAGGGKIRHGPVKLPGDQNEWLIRGDDNEGAKIMFTGPRPNFAA